jgi:hypothetical protein
MAEGNTEIHPMNHRDSNPGVNRSLAACVLVGLTLCLTYEVGRTRGYVAARNEAQDRENRMAAGYSDAMDELQSLRRLHSMRASNGL